MRYSIWIEVNNNDGGNQDRKKNSKELFRIEIMIMEVQLNFALVLGISWDGKFLDASLHLYKRACPSVCWSVGPLVRRLVMLS